MSMAKRRTKNGPGICVDEHIVTAIAEIFRLSFSVIEAGKSSEFRGRDERDYLQTLYERNLIFVTSDAEFVNEVIDSDLRHAGIVYIPPNMELGQKLYFADIARVWIGGGTRDAMYAFRGNTLYPAHDGVRFIRRRGTHEKSGVRPELAFSWDWLSDHG